jgi:hypothetical protein
MFGRKFIFSLITVTLVLITACSSGNDNINSTTVPNSTQDFQSNTTQEESKPDVVIKPEIDFVLPDFSTRPFAVMIDNEGPKPLPQGGLNKAQLIYEIIVEGGATRLMPVFWNTVPEMIGPVRSARDYFINYATELDAIYVHFGGSPAAYLDIKKYKINDIDGIKGRDGGIFWDITDEGSRNWQDTYTNMDKVKNHTVKLKYRTTTDKKILFSYSTIDTDPLSTQEASKVTVKYTSDYSCGFIYDSITKNYLRFRNNKPHMERTTSKQLIAKNIIIQNVRNASIAGDDKGRQSLGAIGKGDGWFITNGKAIKIKWSKASRKAQTQYVDEAGKSIVLNQGQTWIQVLPLNGKVSFNN